MENTANYDVFISYRREGGSGIARLLRESLEAKQLRVFLDVEELETGKFNEQLLAEIRATPNFVIILSPGALDRCVNQDDWVTKELKCALSTKRNIIPVLMPGFEFPAGDTLDHSVAELASYHGVKYDHTYYSAFLNEIVAKVLKGLESDDSNRGFGLVGNLGNVDLQFSDLLPAWCSSYIFKWWPAIIMAQWFLVLFWAYKQGLIAEIDLSAAGMQPGRWKEVHPLMGDYMFIVWNLIPFALVALLYRARKSIQGYLRRIYRSDEDRESGHWKSISKINSFWTSLISNRYTLVVVTAAALYACAMQVRKLPTLEGKGEIYWWDWKLSKFIYIVRDIALFFDIIGIIFSLILVVAMVNVIWKILAESKLQVDVFSGDHSNGLGFIGETLSLFLPFLTILGINSVVGIIDHAGQDEQQVFIDYLFLAGFTVLYFFLMIRPIMPVRERIRETVQDEIDKLQSRRKGLEFKNHNLLERNHGISLQNSQQYAANYKTIEILRQEEYTLYRAFRWPLRRRTLAVLILMGLLPLALFMAIRLF